MDQKTNALILLFTLVPLIFLFFLSLIRNNNTRKSNSNSNLPPSPPSLPIIGHLHLIQRNPLHETLLSLSRKFGPVIMLRFGIRNVVVVSSPSAVEECFTKTNDKVLANRPHMPSVQLLSYNFTALGGAPYGDLWHGLRRVTANELFSSPRLDATTHLREHEVKLMCRHIFKDSWHKVDLKAWFKGLTNNITTMAVIGERFYGDESNIGDVKRALVFRDMIVDLFKLLNTPNIGDFLPFLGWLGTEKKLIGLMKRLDKFIEEVIERRRRIGSCESGVMVDKLLVLQEQDPHFFTDQIVKGFILIMLLAGIETPYLTLEWSMSLILNNSNAMETIKNEINKHVGSESLLQENDLGKLSYLQSVINESLRLYPTLPLLLQHEASDDIKIGAYSVPRGTILMVNAWAIQRDPFLWDEPDKFMPERFDSRGDDKYKMLPFGVGRRACPGINLGYRILGLALGTLIQAFEWEKIGSKEVDMTAFSGLSIAKLKPLQALCKPCSNMTSHII